MMTGGGVGDWEAGDGNKEKDESECEEGGVMVME